MIPRAHIATFGCQMNRQESGIMAALLTRAGYAITDEIEQASLVILETCAIRQRAEDKVYSLLGRLKKRRAEEARAGDASAPALKIAVCGCLVTEEGAADLVNRHGVNVVLGPRRIARIADAVERANGKPVVDIGGEWLLPPEDISCDDIPGLSAFVTVMQGCSNACTFCVVPSRRGAAESKQPEVIIEEVRSLERRGYREVTLIGQNISYYGLDNPRIPRLIDLLRRVEAETSIPRIRFATSHPAYIDRRFLAGFAELTRVMPHLHIPIQSGSDRVLRNMHRGYTAARYLEIVDEVRRLRPDTAVTTDLIAGFDGETLDDHAMTLALIERSALDGAYVYAYSERPGTPAVNAGEKLEKVPEPERLRRCNELLALVELAAGARRLRDVGKNVEVLVEREGSGRTRQNILARFQGGAPGEIRHIRVNSCAPFFLSE
ncbi:MAG: MiaB/RimO family radical SAM methylthiotransferase [Candidatus Hydrogenedentota bacterium]